MDEKLRALARKEVVDVRVVDVARACLRERVRALVGDVKTPYEEMLERIEEYNAGRGSSTETRVVLSCMGNIGAAHDPNALLLQ